MPKLVLTVAIIFLAGICLVACTTNSTAAVPRPTLAAPEQEAVQTHQGITLARYAMQKGKPQDVALQNCVYPAGWQAYTVGEKDTADTIAAQHGITTNTLLQSNCIADPLFIVKGLVIYVPVIRQNISQTILPLSVTYFAADPPQADPNQTITLTWAGQGAIRSVRVGSLYYGQYTELANNLPANGTLQVTLPDDGRDAVNYVVIVGDGSQEVYAQTAVNLTCEQSWFFEPAPSGCPSGLLVTDFVEQRFVNGTVIYIPTLGMHYVMIRGQEAVTIEDNYIPGVSPMNSSIPIPAGFTLPHGAILHLWQNETVQQSLGYGVENAVRYSGIMQRTMTPSGEVLYLSSSSGDIYRLGKGLVWGVIMTE